MHPRCAFRPQHHLPQPRPPPPLGPCLQVFGSKVFDQCLAKLLVWLQRQADIVAMAEKLAARKAADEAAAAAAKQAAKEAKLAKRAEARHRRQMAEEAEFRKANGLDFVYDDEEEEEEAEKEKGGDEGKEKEAAPEGTGGAGSEDLGITLNPAADGNAAGQPEQGQAAAEGGSSPVSPAKPPGSATSQTSASSSSPAALAEDPYEVERAQAFLDEAAAAYGGYPGHPPEEWHDVEVEFNSVIVR